MATTISFKNLLFWTSRTAFAGIGSAVLGIVAASATTDPPSAQGTEITLLATAFDDGQAKFFQYDAHDGPVVRYFVVKASDGTLRAAFDACDTCWASGKGYKQAGDVFICQNCRRRFKTSEIGLVYGGCNPAPLKSETRGGTFVIQVKDILEGRRYFDLPGGGRS